MENNVTCRDFLENIMNENQIKYDKEVLDKVANYGEKVYANKKRISGKTVMSHTLGVAKYIASLKLDDNSVYAAFLHEVIKFEEHDEKELKKIVDKEVIDMVNTISKLSYFNFKHGTEVHLEILRKMFMAIAKDIRTVIIKLADRLYNMQNISEVDEKTRQEMAKESLSIYAPIAHRLGMSQIKSELEDISFRILYPEEYQEIKKEIDQKKKQREEYIKNRIEEITNALKKENIECTIYGRPKHFYSIYKKMKMKNCRADDLFDLLAIRVIVNSVKDCYTVLGIVHDMYKPMPGRFKDYIAVPKTNMYQSLHTTVFGEDAKPFEIQIRTWDMHKVADYGIAAHFSYKEKTSKISEADKKLVWLRQTLEMQKELSDTNENLNKMKVELFGEEVFVFTPKGEIKALPKGSTPIDFAYSIHQKIAEQMVGAKVNSRMVPIYTKLENTDIVEIVTSKSAKGPNTDWLKYVKTSSAKNKISAYLKKQGKEENIIKGKELFEKQLRKQKYSKELLLNEKILNFALKKFNFNTLEDAYENIGFGSISAVKIVNKIVDLFIEKNSKEEDIKKIPQKASKTKNKNSNNDLVNVENIDNCLVKFAKCCSPIPGDEIVGYITYSNGVSIHRKDCANLNSLDIDTRRINVSWKDKIKADFTTKVKILANNRDSIVSDVLAKLKEIKVDIIQMNTKLNDSKEIEIDVVVKISDTLKLQELIKKVRKIDSVFDIRRVK